MTIENTKTENPRQQRGLQIFQNKTIKKHPKKDGWIVPSQHSSERYFVDEEFVCNCADSQTRKTTCKHAFAARYYLQIEQDTPEGTETTKVSITYPQAWSAYNEAQTNEIRLFDELLKDLTSSIEEPEQHMGRPKIPLSEIAFCSIQKVYSQLSSRRAKSLYNNALEKEQITRSPHFNNISNFLNKKETTPLLHRLLAITAQPLQSIETEFAVDSSGFRTTQFNEYASKYYLKRQHRWLKAHICVGVKTNVITGIEITDGYSHDSPQFKPLVEKTADNGFNIEAVTADKAYSSKANLELVDSVGGVPYIPFKSHVPGRSRGSYMWRKMYHYFRLHQEEFLERYHKRSNVETVFHMLKMKFGDKLKSKNPVAQENELLSKVIAHNIVVLIHEIHELGIDPIFNLEKNISNKTIHSE